jgi:hypothetical protein
MAANALRINKISPLLRRSNDGWGAFLSVSVEGNSVRPLLRGGKISPLLRRSKMTVGVRLCLCLSADGNSVQLLCRGARFLHSYVGRNERISVIARFE